MLAKKACNANKFSSSHDFLESCKQIGKWQYWLSLVSEKIASLNQKEKSQIDTQHQVGQVQNTNYASIHPNQLTIAHPTQYFEAVLPRWYWHPLSDPCWTSSAAGDFPITFASITQPDWDSALCFFLSIQWHINESFLTSFIELAYLFWDKGYRFESCNSPAKVATMLRKCINQAGKSNNDSVLTPGVISAKAKSNGKTFPAGYIKGAFPKIDCVCLKKIAVAFFQGKTQCLKDWDFSF